VNIPDDPFIQELLPEFVDTWLNDLEQMPQLIGEKNNADLYRMAHTLKGSCYQFGLTEIGDMGVALMELSKENKWEEAGEMQPKLVKSFQDVKKFLEEKGFIS
jgi:HPt (histidine-containing phosphotransfer) domain-containing protein